MEIRQVHIRDYWDKVYNLFIECQDEVGLAGIDNITLFPDKNFYCIADDMKTHLSLVIEEDGEVLAGLSIFISNHPHYADQVFACTDFFILSKKYRSFKNLRNVVKLFQVAENILKMDYNVKYMQIVCNVKNRLGSLSKILNYKESDIVYIKEI